MFGWLKNNMLGWFFTAVYFVAFLYVIALIFRHTLSPIANLLAIACWVVAFIVSVILADYTVKKIEEMIEEKIKEKYSKND